MAIRPYAVGAGTGNAQTASPLSQFAATTSLQLKNTLTDETGTGVIVFATNPALVTPSFSIPTYATEAAAILGGLASGKAYQTLTGEVRIKL